MKFDYSPFEANSHDKRQLLGIGSPQGTGALPLTPPPFDAKSQRVSTTGEHEYRDPGPNDQRGQCPGLNALANHGYLPRDGRATVDQFVTATHDGFGMSPDLAAFLAVYGAIVDGDGTSWSIGGEPHTGIAGSHHNYECDSSPLKGDLNQYGSLGKLIMPQFMELYNMQSDASTANYNLEVLRKFRGQRFQESVPKNPYFFYGPFDGMAVSQAAFTFIYRFMSNKSEEHSEGILNKEVLKSFMSISGPEGNLQWNFGKERFPDVFYRRNDADLYSIPYFESDVLYFATTNPEILSIGCNQGEVDTYNPFNIATLTNGLATLTSLTRNPLCFTINFIQATSQSLLGLSGSKHNRLNEALSSAAGAGNCGSNPMKSASLTQLKNCPGFTLYGGPGGPIAPGAIQF
ncbi:MAG: hypothetical protein M1831_003624 [Alyxoria varia]|nr:MAG: hypothetical protein M1831_003624 [Alyxoria varia]